MGLKHDSDISAQEDVSSVELDACREVLMRTPKLQHWLRMCQLYRASVSSLRCSRQRKRVGMLGNPLGLPAGGGGGSAGQWREGGRKEGAGGPGREAMALLDLDPV